MTKAIKWGTFKCPRCGYTDKQRSDAIVSHPCPKATKYDNRHDNPNGPGMVELKEQP